MESCFAGTNRWRGRFIMRLMHGTDSPVGFLRSKSGPVKFSGSVLAVHSRYSCPLSTAKTRFISPAAGWGVAEGHRAPSKPRF